jgi:hypothetical protein
MEKPIKCRRRKIGTTRFDVNLDVQLSKPNPGGSAIEAVGVVRNVSMRGALIETHAPLSTNDQLTLSVTLPNQPDLLEIPSVVVRWVRGHQTGVEFLRLDANTSLQLMKFLSAIHNAGRVEAGTNDDGLPRLRS